MKKFDRKKEKNNNKIEKNGGFMRKIILYVICLFITSCISIGSYHYPSSHEYKNTTNPPIGVISTATLGESIISSGYGRDVKVLSVNRTTKFPHFPFSATISEGLYELVYKDDDYEYYNPIHDNKMFFSSSSGEITYTEAQIRLEKSGKICFLSTKGTIWGLDYFSKNLEYTIIPSMFIEKPNSFQQTMIYIGKEKNNIRFSYREFYQNLIRDSYTTEIRYNLDESNIIGFKNFKAEILEATNTQLEYRIISGF